LRKIDFQKGIKFNRVEDFLDFLPDRELEMVELFRELIFESLPDCREKLAYNVPFYYRKRRICFLWPGSVPWGKTQFHGVQLGFCQGYLMCDNANYLDRGSRRQVYTKTFNSTAEIDRDLISSYLFDALEVDNSFP